jgi:hypothetical protein
VIQYGGPYGCLLARLDGAATHVAGHVVSAAKAVVNVTPAAGEAAASDLSVTAQTGL